ncbi:hypothetical protein ACFQU2_10090 [Siccirubricoccus deserti]
MVMRASASCGAASPAPPRPEEDHLPLSPEEFEARRVTGGFALWWEAHGLRYGIPADIGADLAAGRVVVANLSRTVLAGAAARLPLLVLEISAPIEVLAARLAARGREAAADIAARLARRRRCRRGCGWRG